jgi:quinol monooxygenase YgiN
MLRVLMLPEVLSQRAARATAGTFRREGVMEKRVSAPLVRMAELEIDPTQFDAYRTLLAEEIEVSVANEPGVLSLQAVAVKDSPASIRILEIYANQAAYEAHLRTPHFLKYKTLTAGMVRSLRLIETDALLLRAKGGAFDWP